jgi:hypothetical protein
MIVKRHLIRYFVTNAINVMFLQKEVWKLERKSVAFTKNVEKALTKFSVLSV